METAGKELLGVVVVEVGIVVGVVVKILMSVISFSSVVAVVMLVPSNGIVS